MKQAWEDEAQEAVTAPPEVRGRSFARALLIAVPLSVLGWALLAWLL